MDGERFQVCYTVPKQAPENYKQSALMAARRQAGIQLFDILLRAKLPALVDVNEKIEGQPIPVGNLLYAPTGDVEQIRITITLRPAASVEAYYLISAPAWSGFASWPGRAWFRLRRAYYRGMARLTDALRGIFK